MTGPDLEKLVGELRAAAEKANPQGQWKFSPWHIEEGPSAVRAENYGFVANTASDSTAAFIALANPANILALLDELASLRSKLDTARADVMEEAAKAADPRSCSGPLTSYEKGRRHAAAAIRTLSRQGEGT